MCVIKASANVLISNQPTPCGANKSLVLGLSSSGGAIVIAAGYNLDWLLLMNIRYSSCVVRCVELKALRMRMML